MGWREITPPRFRIGSEAAEVIRFRENVENLIYDEALALACNSVEILNHPVNIPQWYVVKTLFERGDIAYYTANSETNAYACGGAGGIDIYGRPLRYVLTPMNGRSFEVRATNGDLAIIRANAIKHPLANEIRFAAARIAEIETAISANLIKTQSCDFIAVTNEKRAQSIKTAMRQKMLGLPVVYVDKDIADAAAEAQNTFTTSGDFFADKLLQLRDAYKQELLSKIGVLSANKYKRERVQSSEVNAGVGEVIDHLYMTIDQYNHDCALAGLPYEMRINASVADLYTANNVEGLENGREVNANV